MHLLSSFIGGGAVGYFAFNGNIALLPLSLLIPIIWAMAANRWAAALAVFAYLLMASRGVDTSIAEYYGMSVWLGGIAWVLPAFLQAFLWFIFWFNNITWRLIGFLIVSAITCLSPVALVAYGNPLAASGALLPAGAGFIGLGFVAIALIISVLAATALGNYYRWLAVGMLAAVLFVGGYQVNANRFPRDIAGWSGMQTQFDIPSTPGQLTAEYGRQLAVQYEIASSENSVFLYGESVGGHWTNINRRQWESESLKWPDKTVFIGAADFTGAKHDNVLAVYHQGKSEIVYRQRFPVPAFMYRPWANDGVNAHFFDQYTFDFNGLRFAALICFESSLFLPYLQSFSEKPDVLFVVANGWFIKEDTLFENQIMVARSWAFLFDIPLFVAQNR